MCWKCNLTRVHLISVEYAAVECIERDGDSIAVVIALACDETDAQLAKHLAFLQSDCEDDGKAVEDTLVGRVYLNALEVKCRLQ